MTSKISRISMAVAIAAAAGLTGASPALAQQSSAQGSNSSTNDQARSADVSASNSTSTSSGAAARDGGSTMSQGDTHTNVDQRNRASSGDQNAGSQRMSADDGGKVQGRNTSANNTATGDAVSSNNEIYAHNGPASSGAGANNFSMGGSRMDLRQDSEARGGSGGAGYQVLDADKRSSIQADNDVSGSTSTTGAVTVDTIFGDPSDALRAGAGSRAFSASGNAVDVMHNGSDEWASDLISMQSSLGVSGDSYVGLQDYSGDDGAKMQGTQTTSDGNATSGGVNVDNNKVLLAGPIGESTATGGDVNVSQMGDSRIDSASSVSGNSGGALVGSQRKTADEGASTQWDSTSESDVAASGDATANLTLTGVAGAQGLADDSGTALVFQNADSEIFGDFIIGSTSGDATAGSMIGEFDDRATAQQSNATVGNSAISGATFATSVGDINAGANAHGDGYAADASLIGDHADASVIADTFAVSGLAEAGAVHTKADEGASVQSENESTSTAVSGDAVASTPFTVQSGPLAEAADGDSSADQMGDTDVDAIIETIAATGDARAGTQVTDLDERSSVQEFNQSGDGPSVSIALSGNAYALDEANLYAGAISGVNPDTLALTHGNTSQQGDDAVIFDASMHANSGDAVVGFQSVTADEGSDAQLNNSSIGDIVASGYACGGDSSGACATDGGNTANLFAGPMAYGEGSSTAGQLDSSNAITWRMRGTVTTGDGIGGSQLIELDDRSSAQLDNVSTYSNVCAVGCDATAANDVELVAGAVANAAGGETATVDQMGGDNIVNSGLTQYAAAASGDSVAGTQVANLKDSNVQGENISDAASSDAGVATATTDFGVTATSTTPFVVGASAFGDLDTDQIGGNSLDVFAIDAIATTGDAISGFQFFGTPGDTLKEVDVQTDNDAAAPNAASGNATSTLDVYAAEGLSGVGPSGGMDMGNHSADLFTQATSSSGDALAGGQVVDDSGGVNPVSFVSPVATPTNVVVGDQDGINIVGVGDDVTL